MKRTGALVQWLKLPAWKVGDNGFEPHSGLQVSKRDAGSRTSGANTHQGFKGITYRRHLVNIQVTLEEIHGKSR